MSEVNEFFEKFNSDITKMKSETGDMISGFSTLFSKTMQAGKLTVREKELIAVGIAVAIQCEPCIKLHVKKCSEAGASREEILEAASVSVMMAGGPGYTHIPVVLDTLDALGL
jgi:AhpD family alkylhydroperoxidase